MNRRLFGVIGHVDHGKTALVRALTGTDTDRLAEEKRRGISIALGFAHLRDGDTEIDLVDMPGHERFVRTMIAGATGLDAVLLVVDAAEGIRPQTVEHIDVAALLGLRRAVVAISKADRADPAPAARAAAALAAAAGLAAPPPIPTSAVTGLGLEALRAALFATETDPRPEDGLPWLPIDRAFAV
ncbi:MAG: GTP-binding protein, partial [Rhodospirillales bacterium]|nr:GTP-binding protein [Rhodospirillales bacterium]